MPKKVKTEKVELTREQMDFVTLALKIAKTEVGKLYNKASLYHLDDTMKGLQKSASFIADLESKFLYDFTEPETQDE